MFWSFILIVLFAWTLLVAPFNMAFKHGYIEIMQDLSILVDGMIYLDIIMMFFTSYIDSKGNLIDDYKLIALHYKNS